MYIIEGNIGAGKSTFTDILRNALHNTHVVSEPLHAWHARETQESLLGHFSYDPCRWAFTMETYAMMQRVRDHLYYQKHRQSVILERSVYSGHYCFARNGFQQGFMTLKEWEIYMKYFYHLIPGRCKPPHGFIFLDASPEVAHSRMIERNRTTEEEIPLSYLQQLDDMHRSFLLRKENVLPDIVQTPVLHLNVDHEFVQDQKRQQYLIDQVRDFMLAHG